MIGLIFIILIAFSVFLLIFWLWFFKASSAPTENYYKLAEKAYESGDYKKVKELLLQMPNLKSNAEATYKLGVAYFKLGEYEEAQACFEKFLKKSPKNNDVIALLAQALELQEKIEEALNMYNLMMKNNPKDINGHLKASKLYYKKEDYQKALEILETAKKNSPDNTHVLFSIIKCKSKMCDMEDESECDKILDEYKKIEGRKDLPSEFDVTVAKVHAMKGDLDTSMEYCKKAVVADAEDVESYQLFGLLQLIKQDLGSAKNNLTIALNIQPHNKETHNLFSYVLCHQVDNCTLSKCRENYYNLIRKHLK